MGYAPDFVNGMINLIRTVNQGHIFFQHKAYKVKQFVDVVLEYYELPNSLIEFKESPSRVISFNRKK